MSKQSFKGDNQQREESQDTEKIGIDDRNKRDDKNLEYEGRNTTKRMNIHMVCAFNDTQQLQELIQAGVSLNQRRFGPGQTPLMIALKTGSLDCAKMLLECADVDVNNGSLSNLLLRLAFKYSDLDLFKILLGKGLDVTGVSFEQIPIDFLLETELLHTALTHDYVKKVAKLLRAAGVKSMRKESLSATLNLCPHTKRHTPERLEYSCVKFVRNHLMSVNNSNLLDLVPKLGTSHLIGKILTDGIVL